MVYVYGRGANVPQNGKTKCDLVAEIETFNDRLRDFESIQAFPTDGKITPIPIQYEVHKYINKRASEIDGRSIDELIGIHIRETLPPDDYVMTLKNYYKKMAGEKVNEYSYRGIDQGGNVKWFDIIGSRILWQGRPA